MVVRVTRRPSALVKVSWRVDSRRPSPNEVEEDEEDEVKLLEAPPPPPPTSHDDDELWKPPPPIAPMWP